MTGKFSKNIILSMAQGFANTYLLYTACELDLFDIIGEAKEKISVQEIAEKADVGTTHISHIETGCTKLSLTTFISIANALDVSADELLCDCINQASNVYETEISLLLKNCSTKEICFIHDLVKNTLISLHNRNLK